MLLINVLLAYSYENDHKFMFHSNFLFVKQIFVLNHPHGYIHV